MQISTQENNIRFVEIVEESNWAQLLRSLPTSNAFATWQWGKYKERMGWAVRRIRISDAAASGFAGCFQLQRRRLGIVTVLLIQGGIHSNDRSDTRYHQILQAVLQQHVANRKLTLLIVNPQAGCSQEEQLGLLRSNFSPVLNSAMYTYVLDRVGGAMAGESLSQNWRRNLRRAQKVEHLSCRWVDDPQDRAVALARMERLYAGLIRRKSFAATIDFDLARDLIVENQDFKIVEACLAGEVIATRIGFVCNDHVLDFLAASADAAKNTYANYLLLWEMIRMAYGAGKLYFNCGGIDPAANMGVFNFKKGLGGRVAAEGPMWLHGSGWMVTHVARLLLSRKH